MPILAREVREAPVPVFIRNLIGLDSSSAWLGRTRRLVCPRPPDYLAGLSATSTATG
jgi:hypothetical protein